jgi:hypothetical protein
MESRKRIPLIPSEAISDLFTAILRARGPDTLFHYEQFFDGRAGPRKGCVLVENP